MRYKRGCMTLWLILAAAGFVAGVINAIAGGGSLVSFPALLLTGMPAVTANATNSLAIWPGSLTSAFAYRRELVAERQKAVILSLPSLLGGLVGSFILLHTTERLFRAVVPWLVLLACALLALQGEVTRRWLGRSRSTAHGVPWYLWLAQLAISIYGGYFGAGMGILMLAAIAIVLPGSLQHANALKVLFGLLINGSAAIYFLAAGAARLPEAALMALASLAGGYAGARLAQKMPAPLMRAVVITYGLSVAAWLFAAQSPR
jgi:uncharacterized membrane protein YfcA